MCFCRKNWSPSWVVLVGNSLVFFKDPKSQTPSSWVRVQTKYGFAVFVFIYIFSARILKLQEKKTCF